VKKIWKEEQVHRPKSEDITNHTMSHMYITLGLPTRVCSREARYRTILGVLQANYQGARG